MLDIINSVTGKIEKPDQQTSNTIWLLATGAAIVLIGLVVAIRVLPK